MSLPLLTTKLNPPTPRTSLVARPRLIARLNEGMSRPLILISAPAGFGKTTALLEWTRQSQARVVWLSLDEGDNDPARFWAYFIAALQGVEPDIGDGALAMLRSQPHPPVESFLTVLLNEIAAFPSEFTLVLDDYHQIHAPAIHEGLTFLLDHLPPQMHLVIASRADPPFPLARWRGRGQLIELRAQDLRFSFEESVTFLSQVMGFDLSADEAAALTTRTEGWITGLQLAALSLQGRSTEDQSAFIKAFAGSQRYIVDYLIEEVFNRQPEHVQRFLLLTSILDRLNGPLCDAVLGAEGGFQTEGGGNLAAASSQEILDYLERSNLFVIPLDAERQWYRYHSLFADVLRHRLRQAQPDRAPELHRRASEWYEQHGLISEAVRHALEAKDYTRSARLVEQNAETIFWIRGEIATFLAWLQALPEELVRSRPRLSLFYAWALLLSGQLAAVEARLEDAERALAASRDGGTQEPATPDPSELESMRGQLAAIRSRLARLDNDLPRAIELSRLALSYLPQDDVPRRSVITLNLGIAYWQSGDVTAATRVLTQASTMGKSAGSALVALGILGDLQAEQGHLHQAAETYRQAIDRAAEDGKPRSPMVAWAWVGMGDLQREWNDLDAAERHTLQAVELAKQWGNADGLAWAWLHVSRLKAARGDAAGAQDALLVAEQAIRQYEVAPWTAAAVAAYRGRLWIDQGNIDEAARWAAARERGLSAKDELSYLRMPEHLQFARLLIAQGKSEQATELLGRLLRQAEAKGLTGRVIEILVLQSLALQSEEKSTEAIAALERALSLAAPEGYIRVFVDEGEPMRFLIAECAQSGGLGRLQIAESSDDSAGRLLAYADQLTMAFPRADNVLLAQSEIQNPKSKILLEPLSEREREIVRLLAEGLSNREIAQKLYLAVGTVKVHLKHIYGKLDVSSRTQAIARARELGLL